MASAAGLGFVGLNNVRGTRLITQHCVQVFVSYAVVVVGGLAVLMRPGVCLHRLKPPR